MPSMRIKPSFATTLSLLTAELERPAPGSEALIQYLFDALFVYVVRAWADESSQQQRVQIKIAECQSARLAPIPEASI
jgi:hypothetical protein